MPVDAEALQKWAQGRLSNSMSSDDEEKDGGSPDDEGGDDEGGPEDRNALWAGEFDGDPATISPEQAEELLSFLETEEPDIYGAIMELAEALSQEDDEGGSEQDALETGDGGEGEGEDRQGDDDQGGFDEDTPAEPTEGDDSVETAKQALMGAVQQLNPEYPELTSGQREKASDYIGEEIKSFGHPSKDSPDWKQAVAIGLSRARAE